MAIIVEEKQFEKIPNGMHQAVCVFIHDIGTHIEEYAGKQKKQRKAIITWEISERMTQGSNAGKRFMISKFYTLSLGEKATLRKDLESWRGKQFTREELSGFDIEKLLDKNCLLNIGETENGKSKILSVSPPIKGSEPLIPERNVTEKYHDWINKEKAKSIESVGEVDEQPESIPVGDDNQPPF